MVPIVVTSPSTSTCCGVLIGAGRNPAATVTGSGVANWLATVAGAGTGMTVRGAGVVTTPAALAGGAADATAAGGGSAAAVAAGVLVVTDGMTAVGGVWIGAGSAGAVTMAGRGVVTSGGVPPVATGGRAGTSPIRGASGVGSTMRRAGGEAAGVGRLPSAVAGAGRAGLAWKPTISCNCCCGGAGRCRSRSTGGTDTGAGPAAIRAEGATSSGPCGAMTCRAPSIAPCRLADTRRRSRG